MPTEPHENTSLKYASGFDASNKSKFLSTTERQIEELALLATRIFQVPFACILVTDSGQCWLSSDFDGSTVDGIFAGTLLQSINGCDRFFEVEDIAGEQGFQERAGDSCQLAVRYLAAVPIVSDQSNRLGSLCILDGKPNKLNEHQKIILGQLGEMAANLLEDGPSQPEPVLDPNWVTQKSYLELAEKFADVGHWHIDLRESRIFWSDQVYRIHGVDPATYRPELTSAIEFYHPDDREHVGKVVSEAIENQKPFEFELRLVRADGEIRTVRSKGECRGSADDDSSYVFGIFQDVTDIRQSEERLKESEERFQLAANASSAGMWDWNIRTNALYWSPRLKEIVGVDWVTDETFTPELSEFETRLHPEDHDHVLVALNAHLEDRTPYDVEYRLRRDDGTYVWIHAQGQAIWSEDGTPLRMAGSVHDITTEVELREEVRRRQEEMELVFNNVAARLLYKDDENRILRLNKSAAKSMGVTIEQAEGASSYDLFPEMAKKYHEDDLAVIAANKPAFGILEEYAPRDGERGWVRSDKIPYIDVNTGKRSILISAIDVTREKIAEEALRASEERFSLAAAGASVGIWDWLDVNSDQEWWSPNFYRLLGYEENEIEPSLSNFRDLLHPDDHSRSNDAVREHFTARTPYRLEYRLKHKTDGYRWFIGTGQASWDEDGNPKRMTGSIMDIDELRQTQEILERRSRKLEQSNRDLDHFARIASHDLRAPLRGMDNVAQWIEEDLGEDVDPGIREKLQLLRGRVVRMERLLSDILAFSRAGQRESEPESVDCNLLLSEVIDWVSAPPGLEIRQTNSLPTITVSRTLVEQMLVNLLTNAVKHHDKEHGSITISYEIRDGFHEFVVTDDGPGIPMEYHDRAFQMFQTLQSRDKVEGSGIGLAIVKKILESVGGYILLISPVTDRGTAFHCGIPVRQDSDEGTIAERVA